MCNEKTIYCPNCNSENISDESIKANNGILGSGYKSWIVNVLYCCNDCRVIFKPIKK